MPDATQQPSKAPKPRRWYRRRGTIIFLFLLGVFIAWFTWSIIEIKERNAFDQRLKSIPNCDVRFGSPEWVDDLSKSSWVPDFLTDTLKERLRFVEQIQFNNLRKSPTADAVLASVAKKAWPNLTDLVYRNETLWNGERLLLPLNCPDLKDLCLQNTQINDDVIEQLLSRCRKINSIELVEHSLSGRGLAGIAHLPDLKTLVLVKCQLANLDFLQKAQALETLLLSVNPITDQHLQAICSCGKLVNLSLGQTQLKGTTLDCLHACPKLKELRLYNTGITDETTKLLPALTELEELHLDGTAVTGIHLFTAGVPANLHSLYLQSTKARFTHLARLKGHASLATLYLNETPCDDEGCEVLSSLPALRTVTLDKTAIGDKTIAALMPAEQLYWLFLKHTNITDSSGARFRSMPRLARLELAHTRIGNDCLAALSGHPKLLSISLEKTNVNDQAIPHLLSMPLLRGVTIHKGQFSPDSIKQLKERNIRVETPEERDLRK